VFIRASLSGLALFCCPKIGEVDVVDTWGRDGDGKLIRGENPYYPSMRHPFIFSNYGDDDLSYHQSFRATIMKGEYIQATKIA
jgi:hypothetical protein